MKYTQITKLYVRGRQFFIVRNADGFYLAVEDKYIDKNGKCKQALNGLQMHAAKDLNNCIDTTKMCVEVDYLEAQGMSRNEAMRTVLNAYA